MFEVKVVFVAGGYRGETKRMVFINPDVGWLDGFDYTVIRRLGVALLIGLK